MPIPVQTGRYSSVNGIVMPVMPGFSQASPSSSTPCAPIATRAASATCSWTFTRLRFSPGRAIIFDAISSPSTTDTVISTKATIAAERDASHHG